MNMLRAMFYYDLMDVVEDSYLNVMIMALVFIVFLLKLIMNCLI
jgi:hypothetical protein